MTFATQTGKLFQLAIDVPRIYYWLFFVIRMLILFATLKLKLPKTLKDLSLDGVTWEKPCKRRYTHTPYLKTKLRLCHNQIPNV